MGIDYDTSNLCIDLRTSKADHTSSLDMPTDSFSEESYVQHELSSRFSVRMDSFSVDAKNPYRTVNELLNQFTLHTGLSLHQQMNISIAAGCEKYRLMKTGTPIYRIDMHSLFIDIILNAAAIEGNPFSMTECPSDLREKLDIFLNKNRISFS